MMSSSSSSEDSLLARELTTSMLQKNDAAAALAAAKKDDDGQEGGGEERETKMGMENHRRRQSLRTEMVLALSSKDAKRATTTTTATGCSGGGRRLVKRRKGTTPAATRTTTTTTTEPEACEHPAFVFGICVHCGRRAETTTTTNKTNKTDADVPDNDDDDDDDKEEENGKTTAVRYLHEGLTVSDKLLREAKREERKATLKQGKIFLVLDLDHTVLNSCRFDEVNDEERATLDAKVAKREEEDELRKTLLGMVGSGNGRGGRRPRFPDLYRLSHFSTYTKLRPYVFEFLEEAAKICRMHVYTMGDKNYAHEMASLIDPEGKYFHGRIIGNSDSTCSKTKDLDIVLGGDDCTMIVDDTSRVWPRHARNLIRVDRYHFFRKSATSFREMEKSSVMERGLDEGEAEEEGAPAKHREVLKDVLAVLTVAHRMMAFSDSGDDGGDAREIRDHKDVRKVFERNNYEAREGQNGEKVDDEGGRDPSSSLLFLKGCVILPSGITPSNDERPDRHPLLLIAVGLGATIATAMNDNVTHVLARSDNTEKVKWGRKRGLFIVNGNWLRECAMQNAKLDEHNFATLQ
tara:strand:+ start:285 stop:2012 length:1728 start_codon:yes stop_codon:yes gene_type:complete